jgi:hypothetical protein
MSVHKMRYVLVNDMVPRASSVCTACSRPLKQGYLHDLDTSRHYCGIECYPQWMVMNGFVWSFASVNAFEFAFALPRLTADVTSAMFDSTWRDHVG